MNTQYYFIGIRLAKSKIAINASPFVLFASLLFHTSCRKLIDIPQPINTITDQAVYSTDATAAEILTGLYISMSHPQVGGFNGIDGIDITAALSADELFLSAGVSPSHEIFFQNNLITSISMGGRSWEPIYNLLYRCNAAIEGITASQTLTTSTKRQLLGEARFLRAFYFFHLVNLFGPVPLTVTTDYKVNSMLPRTSQSEVYKQMIEDLIISKELLSESFLNASVNLATEERVRPTKWAAAALLARIYLYCGDYVNAEAQSSLVISNDNLFRLLPLNEVFLKNSQEAIWQLQPTLTFGNTEYGKIFVIPTNEFTWVNPFYINPSLLNSFEPGDQRRVPGNWVGEIVIQGSNFYYPYKYKDNVFNSDIDPSNGSMFMTEYQMVLRLAEQYLIRAEAFAWQGKIAEAIKDLDVIRSRAGLPLVANTNPDINQEELLNRIYHERRVELFTESAHRWFDLRRTDRINAVMSVETSLKGGVWNQREALYPLTENELKWAINLEQNPGYPQF